MEARAERRRLQASVVLAAHLERRFCQAGGGGGGRGRKRKEAPGASETKKGQPWDLGKLGNEHTVIHAFFFFSRRVEAAALS